MFNAYNTLNSNLNLKQNASTAITTSNISSQRVSYVTSAGTATNAGTLTNKAADTIFVSCSGGNNPGSFGFDSSGRPIIRVYSTSSSKYIPIVFSPSGLIVNGTKEVEW